MGCLAIFAFLTGVTEAGPCDGSRFFQFDDPAVVVQSPPGFWSAKEFNFYSESVLGGHGLPRRDFQGLGKILLPFSLMKSGFTVSITQKAVA